MFGEIDPNGRDGDTTIRELFGRWLAASRPPGGWPEDDEGIDEIADQIREVEDEILATSAAGAAGLSIKAFLAVHKHCLNGAACEAAPEYTETGWLAYGELKGLLADVGRFAPELAPLVAAFLAAPERREENCAKLRRHCEALVDEYSDPLPPGEAGLIEAERRQLALIEAMTTLSREFVIDMETEEQIITPTIGAAEDRYYELIGDAEPETLAGLAVKLRWLCRQECDPDTGNGFVLAQCLHAIEKLKGIPGVDARGAST